MTSEMLNEKAIFNVAREIGSPDARAEYLRQSCGADSTLRERVQVLLRAYEEQASFLESPPPVGVAGTIDQPASESPGTVVGPYKLIEQIGEGGMGTVWMAQQTEPVKRLVALKLIKAGMDSKQVIARFEAERQALALMDHANIARVLDGGTTEGGRPYFVMDLVKGVPITRYCDKHHLTPRQRLELFVPVCQAIQHAHQKGIIHRDLKPSNVLVAHYDGKPVPKVIDFGVAKAAGQALTERTLVTCFGAIVGTLEYMSPEQAEVNQLDIDTRSDIYSLGVLLYELLTGSPPFTRRELEKIGVLDMLRVIREEEPSKPSTKLSTADALPTLAANRGTEPAKLARLVRGELDWIVMKCLEKDRNRRYETANGLARDVERYLADEPVQACPPSVPYRVRKFARRHKAVLATAGFGLVALAAVTALAVGSAFTLRLRGALGDAQAAQSAEEAQRRKAERFQYAQHITLASHALQENYLGRLEQLLDQCPADYKGHWEWRYLKGQCHADLLTLRGHTGGILSVVFTSDGTRLATGGLDGTVRLWDAATGREIYTISAHNGDVTKVALSPDGKCIASAGSDRSVKIWDVESRRLLLTLEGHQSDVYGLAYSPGGQWLASGSWDKTIRLWNPATGALVRTLTGHTAEIYNLAASPDGHRLASAGFDNTVRLWDVDVGRELGRFEGHKSAVVFSVAFSPDGRRLASPGRDKTVKVWDVESRRLLYALAGHTDEVSAAAFSPDGKWIASAGGDNVVIIWDAATGRHIASRRGHSNCVFDVAFSPDGTRIASAAQDRTVRLWPGPATRDAELLVGHTDEVSSLSYSPNGNRIATASRDQTVKIWDAMTRRTVATLTGHAGPVAGAAFSPDGTWLISGGADKQLIRWDLVTARPARTFAGHGAEIRCVAVSADGTRIASGDAGGWVRVWDAATGAELLARRAHDGEVRNVAFHPAGSQLASSGADRAVKVWDAAVSRPVRTFDGHHCWVHAVAFSPDLTRFASSGVPDAAEGADRTRARIATGSGDGTAIVWDLATGQKLFEPIEAHSGFVYSVAFAPDGRRFATAGSEGIVKLWDGEAGHDVLTLKGPGGALLAVAFSPDGDQIAAAGADGTVRIWDARPWVPERRTEREALAALESLFAKPLCKADVREYLTRLRTVHPQARDLSLALIDRYSEEPDPGAYCQAAWVAACQPFLNPSQYSFALRQAETACRLAPARCDYRTALGAAQYRAGKYAEAARSLLQADQADRATPSVLAFLAMTQCRLGQNGQARATLTRLRSTASAAAEDESGRAVVQEAEAVLQGGIAKPSN
jgi:WD40 repeat protein/serine/threonine protein kinase